MRRLAERAAINGQHARVSSNERNQLGESL